MNIDFTYKKIIEILENSNNQNIAKELENCIAGSATGSEALVLSASYLSGLKNSNSLVFSLIKPLVLDYLKYCKDNGIIVNLPHG